MKHMRLYIRWTGILLVSMSATACQETVSPQADAFIQTTEFDFSMSDATVSGSVASAQYDITAITQRVVDFGAIIMYFREQNTWTAMPYTFGHESPDLPAVDFTITLGFGYETGFLEVFYEASTDEIDLTEQPTRRVKAVIIDAVPLDKLEVDLNNYEAVADYLGLQR